MNNLNNNTGCFTGHRRINKNELSALTQKLEETIIKFANRGILYWLNGGAIGFDHLAAFAVLEAKKQISDIKLIMVLPCNNQDEHWDEKDKRSYRDLLENADDIIYVSEQPYFNGCMEKRNKYLVEHSGVCVAYMKHGRSGTSQTVRFAHERGLKIINLAEN